MNMDNKRLINASLALKVIVERLWVIMMRMMPFSSTLSEVVTLVIDLVKKQPELDEKILRASESLKETSSLLSELETGLKERVEKLDRMKLEYDRYSKLAQVEEEKAHVLIQQIELTVLRGKGKERLISLALNLLAGIVIFVLGVFLGPKLTKLMGIQI